MIKTVAFAVALTVLPAAAFAQNSGAVVRDPTGGATRDPALSTVAPGPALTRDPAGGTMIDDTPRFRTYVVQQRIPSYTYAQPLIVGTTLPEEGVVYREVPAEYGAQGYRYTVVNERPVVVEPRTRRVIQVIE
jgi:hypothetical protein